MAPSLRSSADVLARCRLHGITASDAAIRAQDNCEVLLLNRKAESGLHAELTDDEILARVLAVQFAVYIGRYSVSAQLLSPYTSHVRKQLLARNPDLYRRMCYAT